MEKIGDVLGIGTTSHKIEQVKEKTEIKPSDSKMTRAE